MDAQILRHSLPTLDFQLKVLRCNFNGASEYSQNSKNTEDHFRTERAMPSQYKLLDRVHGCLAGVAVGDAMGMPASSYQPHEITERFGRIENLLDAPPARAQPRTVLTPIFELLY